MTRQNRHGATFDGFLHAGDGGLLDGQGRDVLLRGVGLGNWLLPEGYMWRLPDDVDSPRRIRALIEQRVGPQRASAFWQRFRDVFITEDDVRQIAREGLDHVRLPINYSVVMDDRGRPLAGGLARVDQLIQWCRTHRLWVVLDLHGAPGGQTGTNIDDSPHRRPELFEEPRYRDLTIDVWTLLATRYRDETVVAGYDLLNEPLPDAYQHRYASQLVDLYIELTEVIRSIDPHHLIIYEGTHWATNWDIFTEVWDPNSMLQFHRYWCPPDRSSIAPYLQVRSRLGLPIYMGEGGENNPDWLQTAFQLYEDHHISWNFWPWKKIDTLTSPCSVDPPARWPEVLLDDSEPEAAWQALEELLNGMPLHRCTYRPEIINALLHRAPVRLPATGFSFRGAARSYGTREARPLAGFRPDDYVSILHAGGTDAPIHFHHTDGRPRAPHEELTVLLQAGDWLSFDVQIARTAVADITIHLRTDDTTAPWEPAIAVQLDAHDIAVGRPEPDNSLTARTAEKVPAGQHQLRIHALRPVTLRSLEVSATAEC